jgi:hypothetical protein
VTSGNVERDIIWTSRHTAHLFRNDIFTLTGILLQYPEYSIVMLSFLSLIFICVLSIEYLKTHIEFNIRSTNGVQLNVKIVYPNVYIPNLISRTNLFFPLCLLFSYNAILSFSVPFVRDFRSKENIIAI